MHFYYNEYSIRPDEPTIIPTQRIEPSSSIFPTTLDYLHINLLYCNGKDKYWNAFIDSLKCFVYRNHVYHIIQIFLRPSCALCSSILKNNKKLGSKWFIYVLRCLGTCAFCR